VQRLSLTRTESEQLHRYAGELREKNIAPSTYVDLLNITKPNVDGAQLYAPTVIVTADFN
jgi:hypothetical protein